MSDIPIGSPPVPPGRHAAPSGWYPDPVDRAQERYWDGWQWSRNTRGAHAGSTQPQGNNPGQQDGAGQQYHPGQPYGSGPQPNPSYQNPHAGADPGLVATTVDGVPLAGWWWRALAAIVDSILVGIVATVLLFGVYQRLIAGFRVLIQQFVDAQSSGVVPDTSNLATLIGPRDQLLLTFVPLIVGAIYHAAFLRWKAATPGKLLCGLRVVPVDQGRNTAPLAASSIALRVGIWLLPLSTGYLGILRLIDIGFPLWQAKRQALHDLAAKTQVVRSPRPAVGQDSASR